MTFICSMILEKAIQQKVFRSALMKAHMNILYTASVLGLGSTQLFKSFDITWQQFNILRILKGQFPAPASVKLLTERMIDKASNASRLVDRLIEKGYVDRKVCPNDRRQVEVLITDQGLSILEELSKLMEDSVKKRYAHLTEAELEELNRLLDKMNSE